MKSRKLLKIYFRGIIFLCCMVSLLNAETDYLDKIKYQPIAKEQVLETLELISSTLRANYEQIRTWQADVDAYNETVYQGSDAENVFKERIKGEGASPQKITRRTSREISIVLDAASECIYEHSVRQGPMRYFDAKDSSEIAAVARPFETKYIVTPTYYIDCIGNKIKGDKITGYRATKRKIHNQQETIIKKDIFDPRQMIYMASPVWNYLNTWQRKLQENNGDWKIGPYSGKFEEGRDGNDTVYHLLLPGKVSENQYIFMSLFFSEKAGWNIVKLETMTHDFKVLGRMQVEYFLLDGIYVPKKITGYDFNFENQSIVRTEDYVFTKQSLNKEIAKKTFTYENLDLKSGDPFIDEIQGKEYKCQDANLVFVADIPDPASGKKETTPAEPNNPPK